MKEKITTHICQVKTAKICIPVKSQTETQKKVVFHINLQHRMSIITHAIRNRSREGLCTIYIIAKDFRTNQKEPSVVQISAGVTTTRLYYPPVCPQTSDKRLILTKNKNVQGTRIWCTWMPNICPSCSSYFPNVFDIDKVAYHKNVLKPHHA